MRVFTSSPVAAPSHDRSLAPGWLALGAVSVMFHLGSIFYGLTPMRPGMILSSWPKASAPARKR